MQERESISRSTLEGFLNRVIGVRMRSNNHTVWGTLIAVGAELILQKKDGRRVVVLASDVIDISEAR